MYKILELIRLIEVINEKMGFQFDDLKLTNFN